ncbi:ankyrin repeat domain-containing protein [Chitinophaga sp. LS1]|uniref:ankyrin repeat domain-containing protein n=1 Tax=Chitinophaga sp. LS1 TaxID=3051176 RepID=UPI002AABC391|nr:ankyrin repeat domain-containing protein [Chitinophaga sp. LS1]WPV63906.1 ankyrin repeat domain-containing protein [Chitinophaga sp. LS1]
MLSACWDASGTLLGSDYRLFKDTPSWELARAVKREDTPAIRSIASGNKMLIDYQEPVYGKTLLMLAVTNHDYLSATALLNVGADPNKHDSYDGASSMIKAAAIVNDQGDNTRFLKLLLSHGGNPNDEETGPRQEGNTTRMTPLLAACFDLIDFGSPIEKVKLLVKTGADVNHKNE